MKSFTTVELNINSFGQLNSLLKADANVVRRRKIGYVSAKSPTTKSPRRQISFHLHGSGG